MREASVADDGFEGILYPAEGRKDKVVITVSGGEGGMEDAEKMAQFLQSEGIPALAVAYFGTDQTGKWLSRVPLSYIAHAISWLRAQGYERIGMEGIAKGAEYAAAAAVAFPEITCLILKAPASHYSEGLENHSPSGTSSWLNGEKEMPYTPYALQHFSVKRQFLRKRELNLLPLNSGKKVNKASLIPIERVNGPVLLFSSRADTFSPAVEQGNELKERMDANDFRFPHKHIVFTFLSHIMFENVSRKVRYLFRSERQHTYECVEERLLMGEETRFWINEIW